VTVEKYILPQSLDQALSLLAEHGDSLMVMGGGTLLMPLINEGISTPEKVMGLRQAGLDQISRSNGHFRIGAAVTLNQMVDLVAIPMLQEAARNTGAWAVRNLATVGGNLFAPPPAGDFAVALLALEAQLKLAGRAGERSVPLTEFYTGFLSNVLKPGELVTEIWLPVPSGKTAYIKYGRRQANTPAVVTVAAHLRFDGSLVRDARLALNGVGPHPVRTKEAEAALIGSTLEADTIQKAATVAAAECEPFTDAIATEWYRRKMAGVFVKRALSCIAGEEG